MSLSNKNLVSADCLSSGNMHFGSAVSKACQCIVLNLCVCVCVVSAENLEKSLKQMEKHLLQLEKDLDTFSSTDDQQDLFHSKMAISFHTFAYTHTHALYISLFLYFIFLSKHAYCCAAINIVSSLANGGNTFSGTLVNLTHAFTNTNQSSCWLVRINYLY